MIVLDTNVLSAFMRDTPDNQAISWLNNQPIESTWTTSVCVFEVLYGLNILPDGKRKQSLIKAFDQVLNEDLEGRVLDFNTHAAAAAANISSHLKTIGKPVEIRDVEIAGIVAARRGILATRNTKHFEDAEIALVNPWE